jgi:7-carboxy-7-deazaguanine synthase
MKLDLAKMPDGSPEIFYTLQGEGASLGKPAVFLRTSTCNLYCVWCDTPYTWNWDNTKYEHKDGYKWNRKDHSVKIEVEDVVRALLKYDCRRIVITGGEPMLQQTALAEMMRLCKVYDPSFLFEVETNATKAILPHFSEHVAQWNCSPKLTGSGVDSKLRETEYLRDYVQDPRATFKFVVGNASDFNDTIWFIDRNKIAKSKCYLMPEGRTPNEVGEKTKWLAEQAKSFQLSMTPRLHVIIWGAKRGV